MPPGRPRPLLFALALAALLFAAAVLALRADPAPDPAPKHPERPVAPAPHRDAPHAIGAHSHPAHAPGGEDLPAGAQPPAALRPGRGALERAARRFFAAFLRYEVGDAAPAVLAGLRRSCTEEFSAQLLLSPPRAPAAGAPRRARLVGIEITLPGGAAPRALVSGALRRGRSLEGFAYVFERHGRRWLASGVGE
jgi:hypothetical protein